MASQKRGRPAAGQGKNGGTATKSSGAANANPNGRAAGNRSASSGAARAVGTPTRAAAADRAGADRRQSGRTQSGQAQSGQAQSGRSQTGQAQSGRSQTGRAQNDRPRNGRPQNTRPGQGRPDGSPRAGAPTAEPAVGRLAKAAEARHYAPPWLKWTTLALSLAGLGVSIYLTIAHYTSPKILVCSASGLVNCVKVTSSAQSMVFGVFPVAVLGLAFYVFMIAINTPWAWRAQVKLPAIWWARLGSMIVGIGFVLYLVYAELIQIDNICLWCTSVHAITFLLFVLIVFAASMRPTPDTTP
jgi:uncharacterized membrane protein